MFQAFISNNPPINVGTVLAKLAIVAVSLSIVVPIPGVEEIGLAAGIAEHIAPAVGRGVDLTTGYANTKVPLPNPEKPKLTGG